MKKNWKLIKIKIKIKINDKRVRHTYDLHIEKRFRNFQDPYRRRLYGRSDTPTYKVLKNTKSPPSFNNSHKGDKEKVLGDTKIDLIK